MTNYNKSIYGLGKSLNEDLYIEEYRSMALEYTNSTGKMTNITPFTTT